MPQRQTPAARRGHNGASIGTLCLVPLLALAACASPGAPNDSASAGAHDRSRVEVFCYRKHGLPDKARFRTCTTAAVPAPAVQAEAKRFEPVPDAAILYVVRRSRIDSKHLIPVVVNEHATVDTIPRSFFRVRLLPGQHQVAFQWHGVKHTQPLRLGAGEVAFVELDASGSVISPQYDWVRSQGSIARDEAMGSTLIADLDVRR